MHYSCWYDDQLWESIMHCYGNQLWDIVVSVLSSVRAVWTTVDLNESSSSDYPASCSIRTMACLSTRHRGPIQCRSAPSPRPSWTRYNGECMRENTPTSIAVFCFRLLVYLCFLNILSMCVCVYTVTLSLVCLSINTCIYELCVCQVCLFVLLD